MNEDSAAFESLIARYEAHFDPQNPIQEDLVEEIAAARWRQRRIWNIQTAAVDHEMDRQEPALKAEYAQIDQCTRIALAVKHLTDNSKLLSNLSRYESRHRRAYDRAVEKLERQEKIS
jgi:cytochrome c biogenesis protein ResB